MKKLALGLLLTLALPALAVESDDYNFRFSPVGLIIGSVTANLDIKVDDDWTVGPEFSYWHFSLGSDSLFTSDWNITAYGIGARGNWFKNGAYKSGLYVGPSIQYLHVALTTTDFLGGSVSGSASALYASCLVGYGWFWKSFNMMLGGGGSVGFGGTKVSVTTSNGTTTEVADNISGLAIEYSLGFTF